MVYSRMQTTVFGDILLVKLQPQRSLADSDVDDANGCRLWLPFSP